MAKKKHRYRLSRTIPEEVRLKVRQDCGFGCVICGCAIYEYHHFEPEFSQAKTHDPAGITLLCGQCHAQATRAYLSPASVAAAAANPRALRDGESQFPLDVGKGDFVVVLGGVEYVNTPAIIGVFGETLLSISAPPVPHSAPELSAMIFDQHGRRVASIERNVWHGSSKTFDIRTTGGRIRIRSRRRQVALDLQIEPPNRVVIRRLDLFHREVSIVASRAMGLIVKARHSAPAIPSDVIRRVERAQHGVVVDGDGLHIGADGGVLAKMVNFRPGSAPVDVRNARLELIDARDHPDPPPGAQPGDKIVRLTRREGGRCEFMIEIEESAPDA
jgi:hypothetical protein